MFKFQKLKSILTEEFENIIDVTCPQCGQVTSFSYSKNLPEQDEIVCVNCRADLKNKFFKLLLENEIGSLEVLKTYVIKIIFLALVLALLIGVYLFFTRRSTFAYFILAIPFVVLIVTCSKYYQIKNKVKELKELKDKFGF